MADDAVLAQRAQIEQKIAGRTLCDVLDDNADRYGEAPAACWRDGATWHTLSWGQYRQRVVEVAAGLASLGVDHGDFVALMMANRPEHVLADQGAVHAGAVPITLYATFAPEQIGSCAADCAFRSLSTPVRQSQMSLVGRPCRAENREWPPADVACPWRR
jgi:long-chain acyl-CoA synthetase